MARIGRWAIHSRYVRDNRSGAQPGQIVILDTVAQRFRESGSGGAFADALRVGYVTAFRWSGGRDSRRRSTDFYSPDRLWEFLEHFWDPHRQSWVFCTDAFRVLTLCGFWEQIDSGRFSIQHWDKKSNTPCPNPLQKRQVPIMCLNNPPLICRCYHCSTGATVTICDLKNYFGAKFSATKTSRENCFVKSETHSQTDANLLSSLQTSVQQQESLLLNTLRSWREMDLGQWRWTASGLAMSAFRHRFKPNSLLCHQCPEARAIERAGYFGGQTEPYWIGQTIEPIYHLDVSSLYPSVMAANKFPFQILECVPCLDHPAKMPPLISPANSIAIVKVRTDRRTYPLRKLPHSAVSAATAKHATSVPGFSGPGCVAYCQGEFVTTLVGPELVDAVAHGEIVEWYGWCQYRCEDVFSRYVQHFWSQRIAAEQAGDNTAATLAKLLLNTLYGKFGQQAHRWRECPQWSIGKRWGTLDVSIPAERRVVRFRAIAGLCQEECPGEEHEQAIPSIAAFVTAYGRERMRKLRMVAGPENVLYQAVDSLIVREPGYHRLTAAGVVADRDLGMLRVKGRHQFVQIAGCNAYNLDGQWTLAGVPDGAEQITDRSFLAEMREGASELAHRGGPDQTHQGRSTTWKIRQFYGHRLCQETGRLSPICIA